MKGSCWCLAGHSASVAASAHSPSRIKSKPISCSAPSATLIRATMHAHTCANRSSRYNENKQTLYLMTTRAFSAHWTDGRTHTHSRTLIPSICTSGHPSICSHPRQPLPTGAYTCLHSKFMSAHLPSPITFQCPSAFCGCISFTCIKDRQICGRGCQEGLITKKKAVGKNPVRSGHLDDPCCRAPNGPIPALHMRGG